MMKTLADIHKLVFVVTYGVLIGVFPIFMHWKIYQLYKLAGERVREIGFFWFSVYVQSPSFGRGAKVLEELPEDLHLRVASFRDWRRKFIVAIVLWIVFLILFGILITRLLDGQ